LAKPALTRRAITKVSIRSLDASRLATPVSAVCCDGVATRELPLWKTSDPIDIKRTKIALDRAHPALFRRGHAFSVRAGPISIGAARTTGRRRRRGACWRTTCRMDQPHGSAVVCVLVARLGRHVSSHRAGGPPLTPKSRAAAKGRGSVRSSGRARKRQAEGGRHGVSVGLFRQLGIPFIAPLSGSRWNPVA